MFDSHVVGMGALKRRSNGINAFGSNPYNYDILLGVRAPPSNAIGAVKYRRHLLCEVHQVLPGVFQADNSQKFWGIEQISKGSFVLR